MRSVSHCKLRIPHISDSMQLHLRACMTSGAKQERQFQVFKSSVTICHLRRYYKHLVHPAPYPKPDHLRGPTHPEHATLSQQPHSVQSIYIPHLRNKPRHLPSLSLLQTLPPHESLASQSSGHCHSSQQPNAILDHTGISIAESYQSYQSHTKAPCRISDKLSTTISIAQRSTKRGMQKAENKISTHQTSALAAKQYMIYQIS
jgi:hypothetical protein